MNGKAQQDLPKTETYVIHKYRAQGLKFYIWVFINIFIIKQGCKWIRRRSFAVETLLYRL